MANGDLLEHRPNVLTKWSGNSKYIAEMMIQ